jgi:hypothetical protein
VTDHPWKDNSRTCLLQDKLHCRRVTH